MSMIDFKGQVPFFPLQKVPDSLKREWLNAISECLNLGIYINGSQVQTFEKKWAEKLRCGFALGVSNGQDALILALRALGVQKGDLVVVPAHSFIATHNAVLAVGANPISVDVNRNGLISLEAIEKLPFVPTAIIAVHIHGMICDIERIMEWAKPRGTRVIEDCSQAHLANQNGLYVGTIGDIGVFSLYPTKNLGALGDAGVIVTNLEKIYLKMRRIANYGSDIVNKYKHLEFGLNNRLDEIQAAVLNVNLKYLQVWNDRRREIALRYFSGLVDLGIETLQPISHENVWHHFCILHKNRDLFRHQLLSKGIQTEVHYPNLAAIECENFSGLPVGLYPNAEYIASRTLSLPISPWHDDEEIDYVIESIRDEITSGN